MFTSVEIAQVCHEANRAYCALLKDKSQLAWEDAPRWQKESATNGVVFHKQNPEAGPSHSHNSWLEEKKLTGWKYGPVKDEVRKEHPCIVPYEELPLEQRMKDYIFAAIVTAMTALD